MKSRQNSRRRSESGAPAQRATPTDHAGPTQGSGPDVSAPGAGPFTDSAHLSTQAARPKTWRAWPKVLELPWVVRKVLDLRPKRGLGVHHSWLYRASCTIHEHTDWPQADAVRLFEAMTRGEDMGPGEIMDAIYAAWSSKARGRKPIKSDGGNSKPRPSKWPGVEDRARDAIIQTGGGLAALKAASSHRIDAKAPRDPARYLRALFDDGTNPLICQGKTKFNFLTRPLLLWLEKSRMLTNSELVVPSPMTAIKGLSKKGKISEHTLAATGPRWYLIVEQDSGSIDEQASILLHLAEHAPLVCAVFSGGRSVHGWFFVKGQPEARVREFFRYAVSLGADPRLWGRSQFARLPDGIRAENGTRQSVYFYAPEVVQ